MVSLKKRFPSLNSIGVSFSLYVNSKRTYFWRAVCAVPEQTLIN